MGQTKTHKAAPVRHSDANLKRRIKEEGLALETNYVRGIAEAIIAEQVERDTQSRYGFTAENIEIRWDKTKSLQEFVADFSVPGTETRLRYAMWRNHKDAKNEVSISRELGCASCGDGRVWVFVNTMEKLVGFLASSPETTPDHESAQCAMCDDVELLEERAQKTVTAFECVRQAQPSIPEEVVWDLVYERAHWLRSRRNRY